VTTEVFYHFSANSARGNQSPEMVVRSACGPARRLAVWRSHPGRGRRQHGRDDRSGGSAATAGGLAKGQPRWFAQI